jgi:hypothetical protein
VSANYFAVNPLLVHREDGALWTECPECPGWTAAAPAFDDLFRLVSEWHADKDHGWTMFEPFASKESPDAR